jgi:signal transduction histidine kinase
VSRAGATPGTRPSPPRPPRVEPARAHSVEQRNRADPVDNELLRRVRWRLVAWSGGLTLVVLLVLGAALYTAVAGALEAAGTEQLRTRARDEARSIETGPAPAPAPEWYAFGGPTSGTIAFFVGPDQPAPGLPGPRPIQGLPDQAGIDAAYAGREDVRKTTIEATPVRILTTPVEVSGRRSVLQVVQDRTAEERALGVLLAVLVGGGLLAFGLSLALGYGYAARALVPIRNSLARQRQFAAEASHELRTPLTIIRASLEDLRRHRDRPVAEVGSTLDDMDAEAERLSLLVDDLLLLARTDSGAVRLDRQPADLAEVAVAALPGLSKLAATRGVRLQLDPAPAPLRGDADRLRQLVTILVDNAIRHSPPDGTVLVRVRGGDAEGRRKRRREVTLEVEDEGRGIREDDLPRLFDRFWRARDAPTGGSGLGLAIASWIVKQHGGSIEAANRPEGGSRFSVRLPAR